MADTMMIEAEALTKRYGQTQALAGVSLQVPAGSILGVLGPNGAGKTTAVRILTTLAVPNSGHARIAGHDVVTEAAAVRRTIGVTAQDATLDDLLTGRQNLVMVGELSGLHRGDAKRRAVDLLARFQLTDAADRVLKGYSGGMRRRLDLAAGLVMRPPVLFLDEPTTGLDPTGRAEMWQIIRGLVSDGATLLLTTQYLEEADELADRVGFITKGRIVAEGAPEDLKRSFGQDLIVAELRADDRGHVVGNLEAAISALSILTGVDTVAPEGSRLVLSTSDGPALLSPVAVALGRADLEVTSLTLRTPTLDDVFRELTGSGIESEATR
jgi:ABC-2 type transport system ATP-binding protein